MARLPQSSRYNDQMQAQCHRCHSELSESAEGPRHSSDDAVLFCPRCSAPQLLLPEHMRLEDPLAQATTGMLPPPRIGAKDRRQVDWRTAFPLAAGVAGTGAVLTMVGLRVNAVAFLSLCWLLSGAVISLALYSRRRPRVWMDGRIGLRIGLVTGLLMLGALAVTGAGTGVVMRFGTHTLQAFDRQGEEQAKLAQAWGVRWLQQQDQDKEVQERYIRFVTSPAMTSPEMKAGTELAQLAFEGSLLLLVAAGGGAIAGIVQGRRGTAVRAN